MAWDKKFELGYARHQIKIILQRPLLGGGDGCGGKAGTLVHGFWTLDICSLVTQGNAFLNQQDNRMKSLEKIQIFEKVGKTSDKTA